MADDVLREAQAAAAQLREQTIAMLDAQLRQAQAQGFAQGHAQAMTHVLGTLEVERRLRELLSHRLADVVEHCLRGLLGEFGEHGLMRQRVLHLLHTAGSSLGAARAASTDAGIGPATLYVCPEQLPLAQQVVNELNQGLSGSIAGLKVVADDRRAPDSLLLETRVGFIESNITLTLQEMRSLLQQSLDHATQALGGTR
jgi:flagellar biosynthesis/type III secretory pathway protein FliH